MRINLGSETLKYEILIIRQYEYIYFPTKKRKGKQILPLNKEVTWQECNRRSSSE